MRTAVSPDPKFVKWINPDIPRGEEHDVAVTSAKPAAFSRWIAAPASFCGPLPFPSTIPNFVISNIDVKTGKTYINWDLVFKQPGEHHVICYWNTRSYWPTAYDPETNSTVSYIDNCRDLTSAGPAAARKLEVWSRAPDPIRRH